MSDSLGILEFLQHKLLTESQQNPDTFNVAEVFFISLKSNLPI